MCRGGIAIGVTLKWRGPEDAFVSPLTLGAPALRATQPRLRRIEADMTPQSKLNVRANNKKPSAPRGLRTAHTNACQELLAPGL